MKTILLLLCFVISAVLCSRPSANDRKEFLDYVKKFNKNYEANEIPKRFAAFMSNKAEIGRLSADARRRGLNTKFGYTKFSDLTADEFKKYYLGYKPHPQPPKPKTRTQWENAHVEVPNSLDWRTKGAVSAVKDQGQCGSCWAFSATEGVESGWFICGHSLPDCAPQQIVDCDTTDQGCNGGDLPTAFQYIQSAGGLEDENDYPYTAEDGTCNFNAQDIVAKITGFEYATQSQNESAMQAAMVTVGPLSVCVDASSWQNYDGGVITSCGDSLDHCVQIVGWDTYSDGTPYWTVRNSWGTDWGNDGYVYVERNQDECGIAEEATYVTC